MDPAATTLSADHSVSTAHTPPPVSNAASAIAEPDGRSRLSSLQIPLNVNDRFPRQNVPLPESESSSQVEEDGRAPARQLLEQLEDTELHHLSTDVAAPAGNIRAPEPEQPALPAHDAPVPQDDEISPVAQFTSPGRPQNYPLPPPNPDIAPPLPAPENDFLTKAEHLAEWLVQIRPVVEKNCCDREAGRVRCYDYYRGKELPRIVFDTWQDNRSNKTELLQRSKRIEDERIRMRLLVVEDLSPYLIASLGNLFDLDPEFFAEHLNRSGYQGVSYEEPLPQSWNTSNFNRPCVSLKWYRPVSQNRATAKRLSDYFLRKAKGREGKEGKEGKEDFEPWEKRPRYELQRGRKELFEIKTAHQWRLCTNIFRRGWVFSARDDESTRHVSAAWEERASLFIYKKEKVPIFILLLDPLPKVIDHQIITTSAIQWTGRFAEPDTDESTFVQEVYRNFVPRQSFSLRFIPRPSQPQERNRHSQQDQMPPIQRWSEHLKRRFKATNATAEDLHSWITNYEQRQDESSFNADPFFAILQIVRIDTMAFLDKLDLCLQEISKDSLNDYLLYNRRSHWRLLMNQFENQVPEIQRNLDNFVNFAYQREAEVPAHVKQLLLELSSSVDRFFKQMEAAYSVLREDLSILESKRSLSEAENVTKLTELAFAFIPLTFACSVLALPLAPLPDKLPLQTFVAAAVILACLSYGVRLILRSDSIEVNTQRALEIFWKKANLTPGSKIPTHILVLLTIREVWTHRGPALTFFIFGTMLSISVVPIAFLWIRTRLDIGLNVIMTLLVIPFGFTAAWFFASSTAEGDDPETSIPMLYRTRMWIARLLPRPKSRRKSIKRNSVA